MSDVRPHSSVAPVPEEAKPAEQTHVDAPAALVLPAGQAVHAAAVPTLKVLGKQATVQPKLTWSVAKASPASQRMPTYKCK
jgi:hypothetical protein